MCESELIRLLKQNNKIAYDNLYEKYARSLYGIILPIVRNEHTAEDVLQDTFIRIWSNVEKYDPSKGALYTWISTTARNLAIDSLRSKANIMYHKIDWNFFTNDNDERAAPKSSEMYSLSNIINTLPSRNRDIIRMVYYNGFTIEQSSEILNLPLGTTKSRLRTGIKALKRLFETEQLHTRKRRLVAIAN